MRHFYAVVSILALIIAGMLVIPFMVIRLAWEQAGWALEFGIGGDWAEKPEWVRERR